MENYSVEIGGKEQVRTLPYMQDPFTFMLGKRLPQLVQWSLGQMNVHRLCNL